MKVLRECQLIFWGVIDDVLVTKDGYENLTTAPKGIEEMERIIAGGSLDGEDRG